MLLLTILISEWVCVQNNIHWFTKQKSRKKHECCY